MKKSLILYTHGLGDIIQITPILRHLYENGFITDIMGRESIKSSMLLDYCPYVGTIIPTLNPWQSPIGFNAQNTMNVKRFELLSKDYDWSGVSLHMNMTDNISKTEHSANEFKLFIKDMRLEVFINEQTEFKALRYIEDNYPNGYIFMHTRVDLHPIHSWDATDFITSNLPDLPIIDTGVGGDHFMKFSDINFSFVLAREATHRVLASSVFVHACDAMGVTIDAVNYGNRVRKAWPLDTDKLLRIRENGKWIK